MKLCTKHNSMIIATRKGFTLIEMMIVAALISIMSAAATVSIMTMMEQGKQRATVAECRQVATAVGFVMTDLGFYPKLCFLRMGYNELVSTMNGTSLAPTMAQFEYHGHSVNNLANRLLKSWSRTGAYMSSSMTRNVKMTIPGLTGDPYYWPGDPWGNPYVMYLMKSEFAGGKLQPKFIEKSGEHPDYFAAVVSYGRNTVPGGLADKYINLEKDPAAIATRLYNVAANAREKEYIALQPGEYNTAIRISPALLNIDSSGNPTTPNTRMPRMREPGSDDLIIEF